MTTESSPRSCRSSKTEDLFLRSFVFVECSIFFEIHIFASVDPPMFLLTKLDEALILYKRKSGGSSSLVPCINGGR